MSLGTTVTYTRIKDEVDICMRPGDLSHSMVCGLTEAEKNVLRRWLDEQVGPEPTRFEFGDIVADTLDGSPLPPCGVIAHVNEPKGNEEVTYTVYYGSEYPACVIPHSRLKKWTR